MKKFIEIIKNKWLINTSKTFALIAIMVALFIGINYGIQKLDLKTIDLTENKLYSLTDESKEKIKDINKEINIYFFGYENDDSSVELAKQYTRENKNIKVTVADAEKNADLYTKYEVEDGNQGVVVACDEKSKILTSSDFYTYDYSSYEQIDTTEQTLTSAILNIITDEKPQVYFLTGHSEAISKLSTFNVFLQNEINDVNTLDLITSEFPEKCDCLILTTPTSDYSELEKNKIVNYINNGGNILCLMDGFSDDFVNLKSILDLYGVSVSTDTVKESDTSKTASGDTRYIIPNMSYHKITEHLITDGLLMFVNSSKLDLADDDKLDSLNVESTKIIESNDTSYLSSDSNTKGPFTLGAELSKKIDDDKTSKLIIYSNSKFAQDTATIGNQTVVPFTIYSNKDLLLNTVAYLTEKDSSITIRKNTNTVTYTATEKQNNIVLAIIFIIPILIILIGIIIAFIRKRKK